MKEREYLKELGKKITDSSVRKEIVNEYEAHIEDCKAALMESGMTEVEAEEEAVRQMGDPQEAGEAMDKIYIDQVVIGSCTNGRMEDLRKAVAILKGKKVADNVRVMVVPATQKIYLQCILEGILETFVEAGCAVNTPSCGPCMGGHMGVLAKGEKCVSTTNRNFVGRMGDVESLIYLASPETAAASAIAGYIANPEKFGGNN